MFTRMDGNEFAAPSVKPRVSPASDFHSMFNRMDGQSQPDSFDSLFSKMDAQHTDEMSSMFDRMDKLPSASVKFNDDVDYGKDETGPIKDYKPIDFKPE